MRRVSAVPARPCPAPPRCITASPRPARLDPAAGRQRMDARAPRAPRCACSAQTPAFAAQRYTRCEQAPSQQTTSEQPNRTDSRSRPAASSVGTMTSQSCASNAAAQPRMQGQKPTANTRLLDPLRKRVLEVRKLRHARPRRLRGRPQRAEDLEELVNLRVAGKQRPVVDHLHEDAADGPAQASSVSIGMRLSDARVRYAPQVHGCAVMFGACTGGACSGSALTPTQARCVQVAAPSRISGARYHSVTTSCVYVRTGMPAQQASQRRVRVTPAAHAACRPRSAAQQSRLMMRGAGARDGARRQHAPSAPGLRACSSCGCAHRRRARGRSRQASARWSRGR